MKLTKKQIQARRKWANALMTSRKVKKQLRNAGNGRCCLGVMCEMFYPGNFGIIQDTGSYNDNTEPVDIGISHTDSERDFGLTQGELVDLMGVNDGQLDTMPDEWGYTKTFELSHPEIGMYLYMTCAAGETPYNDCIEYILN